MLPWVLAADVAGTLTIADRTEVRALETQGAREIDLATAPSLRVESAPRPWSWGATYAPVVTLPALDQAVTLQVLHAGNARVGWSGRRASLTLSADGNYGQQNFAYLVSSAPRGDTQPPTVPTTPNVQLLPSAQTIQYGLGRVQLFASVVPARRWTLALGPTLLWSGGLDDVSRTVSPAQAIARGDAYLDFAASRRDHAVTGLAAWVASASPTPCTLPTELPAGATLPPPACHTRAEVLEATEAWRRRLSRLSDLSIALGASSTWERRDTGDAYRFHEYPVAEVTLTDRLAWERPNSARVSMDVRLAPLVDARFGTIDQRLQGTLSGEAKIDRTSVRVSAAATRSMPPGDDNAVAYVGGDVEVGYSVARGVTPSVGARYAWQKQPPFEPLSSTVILFALTLRADPLRL